MSLQAASDISSGGALEGKKRRIEACLDNGSGTVDLWSLRELALTRGGLVDSETRQRAWPLLVGLSNDAARTADDSVLVRSLNDTEQDIKERDLIRREAGRSVLFRFIREGKSCSPPPLASEVDDPARNHKEELVNVLEATVTLQLTPLRGKIHYYQGLHDIAGLLIYNLHDPSLACLTLQRICASHLRDAMRKDFSQLMWLLNAVFLPLVQAVDADLHDYLVYCELELPNAVLPWLLTWFSHDTSSEIASRFTDAFLVSHPLFSLYVAVALLTHPSCRNDIAETDCDRAMVHMTIQGLLLKVQSDKNFHEGKEAELVTVQGLVDDALTFMRRHPPRSLLCLAKGYNGPDGILRTDLTKAEFLSLLKAPPSWALSSTTQTTTAGKGARLRDGATSPTTVTVTSDWPLADIQDQKDRPKVADIHDQKDRAKVASGVELLMSTVGDDVVFSERLSSSTLSREPEGAKSPMRHILSILYISKLFWKSLLDFTRNAPFHSDQN